MDSSLPIVATAIITGLPIFAIDVVLIVLAVSRWNRHPRASMYAASAGVLMLVVDVATRVLGSLLPLRMAREGSTDMAQLAFISLLVSGAGALMHAVGFALLVAAVFVERTPSAPR